MSAEVSGSLISQLKDAVDRRADSDWDGRGASASSDKRDFINPTRVASGSLSSRKSVGTDFDPDDGKWIVPTEEEASDDKLGKMSSKPRRASSQKILSSPRTSGSRSVHRSSEVLLNIKSVVQEWSSLTHVEVIHRQGIHAPPLMFEYEQGSPRPVFRTFLPAKDLSESYLYCRKKQKEEIFRFSMDANNMQKHRNPKYVATMAVDACDPFHFRLYNKLEVCVADIKINPMKKKVTVILVNEYLNVYEKGFSGRTLV